MKTIQQVLTTGQVAKICNVAPRTVSKWFDSGQLRGYRIPGSRDRRIPMDQLLRFMEAHGLPLNGLGGDSVRILVVDGDEELAGGVKSALQTLDRYRVEVASCVFSAGMVAEHFRPHVIIVDPSLPDMDLRLFCRCLRGSAALQGTKLIAMRRDLTEQQGQEYARLGFETYVSKPFDVQAIVQAIENAVESLNQAVL